MKQLNVGIIGTGWCGGIRANTCASSALINEVHIAETKADRLAEVAKETGAITVTADYRELLDNDDIDAIIISATPENTHYPMTRDSLLAGKHVLLEKPLALELDEADELISLANSANLKFAIGYSQRFNPKFAYVKQCISDGTLGDPVSALVSRHINKKPRQEDQWTDQALPRGNGSDPRYRLCALVFGAGKTDPCVRSGGLSRHEAGLRCRGLYVDYGDHGRWHRLHDRCWLDHAAGLPQLLINLH